MVEAFRSVSPATAVVKCGSVTLGASALQLLGSLCLTLKEYKAQEVLLSQILETMSGRYHYVDHHNHLLNGTPSTLSRQSLSSAPFLDETDKNTVDHVTLVIKIPRRSPPPTTEPYLLRSLGGGLKGCMIGSGCPSTALSPIART